VFERYTETARRTIFFARFEASKLVSSCIEPEHLLLGLLQADRLLAHRLAETKSAPPSRELFRPLNPFPPALIYR
jgi:ATP-dependent Clp protease ATP-binding subunit ClpC